MLLTLPLFLRHSSIRTHLFLADCCPLLMNAPSDEENITRYFRPLAFSPFSQLMEFALTDFISSNLPRLIFLSLIFLVVFFLHFWKIL